MSDDTRLAAFFDKADKLLSWAEKSRQEMRAHSNAEQMSEVERVFFILLFQLGSAREAIESASSLGNMRDWRDEFARICLNDQLLCYMWNARNSETHDAIVKWQDSGFAAGIRVLDPKKANAIPRTFANRDNLGKDIMEFIYGVKGQKALIERIKKDRHPSAELMDKAGVKLEFGEALLVLVSFSFRAKNRSKVVVPAPEMHLGKRMPPYADLAALFTIAFYRSKLNELRSQLPPAQQAKPLVVVLRTCHPAVWSRHEIPKSPSQSTHQCHQRLVALHQPKILL